MELSQDQAAALAAAAAAATAPTPVADDPTAVALVASATAAVAAAGGTQPADGGGGMAPEGAAGEVPVMLPPAGAEGLPPMGAVPPEMVPPPAPVMVPPTLPPAEPESLPEEQESEGWLELLRDGYARQLRQENEYLEPPPFHRAIHYGVEPHVVPVPPGRYPKQALNTQLQLLMKHRFSDGALTGKALSGKGPGKNAAVAALAPLLSLVGGNASLLPALIQQLQQKGALSGVATAAGGPGVVVPPNAQVNNAQLQQLLLQAAKTVNSGGGGRSGGKGWGKNWGKERRDGWGKGGGKKGSNPY